MHCWTQVDPGTNASMMVLACVRLPHEDGKVPDMLLYLTSKRLSFSTANKLSM